MDVTPNASHVKGWRSVCGRKGFPLRSVTLSRAVPRKRSWPSGIRGTSGFCFREPGVGRLQGAGMGTDAVPEIERVLVGKIYKDLHENTDSLRKGI